MSIRCFVQFEASGSLLSTLVNRAVAAVPIVGCIAMILAGPLAGGLAAQEDALNEEAELVEEAESSDDEGDLAKKSQNPVGDLASLPFQNNTIFGFGPGDDIKNVLNIQPVYPVHLGEGWNLINRVILPVIYQPELVEGQGSTTGLGDTSYTAFFSPRKPSKLIWGAGPVFQIPTSTDIQLGNGEWAAGPSVVALTMPGSWVVGVLASNIWSFNSDGNMNFFFGQIFANYNMTNGWFLTSAPIITANWEAESGQRWTVPVGGGLGRVFSIGKQPVNSSAQVFYNVEKPALSGDWTFRFQFTFLFPK
jgi:hypothetical protein